MSASLASARTAFRDLWLIGQLPCEREHIAGDGLQNLRIDCVGRIARLMESVDARRR